MRTNNNSSSSPQCLKHLAQNSTRSSHTSSNHNTNSRLLTHPKNPPTNSSSRLYNAKLLTRTTRNPSPRRNRVPTHSSTSLKLNSNSSSSSGLRPPQLLQVMDRKASRRRHSMLLPCPRKRV